MLMNKEFDLHNNIYYKKSLIDVEKLSCDKEFWNVDETIPELSYLTHDYFRYYGKFPSKVGKMIIEELIKIKAVNPKKEFIIDNYAGSGTTLVEAKLAGVDSVGIDINPFAVLACRVKTSNYDLSELRAMWMCIEKEILRYNTMNIEDILSSISQDVSQSRKAEIEEMSKRYADNADFTKWFSEKVIYQLVIIKIILLEFEYTREREFFDLAFFAIIRRVSYAHDAEVRPHVNKKKRKRDVVEAYIKKVNEMLCKMEAWNTATDCGVYSDTFLASNADEVKVKNIIYNEKNKRNKELGAIVSHPPYLNCFDYIPVYKLKFMWAEGFYEIFGDMSYEQMKKAEIKSYPVNNDEAITRYFEHNYSVYKTAYDSLRHGGYCCIVIGDCTVKKELFSVHKSFITMMEEIGFSLYKLVYRSTAYGMGKYAYNFRADYSENTNRKQDAILFFKK